MTEKDATPSSTHPPHPPPQEDDQFDHLRLLRSRRVGIATYKRLLAEHGTAQNALAALPQVARAAGVSDYRTCPEAVITAELRAARRAGAVLIGWGDPCYPALLRDVPDAPPFLWAIGRIDLLTRPMVALVGARNASSLGTRMAQGLARDLGAAGLAVVSGLARGIDAAAHLGALEAGTIAVQAGGVDVIYPAENTDLARKIADCGLRLSEQPMGLQPVARHFPARNRIISGLARATVVVEAAARSGSLITARDALDQGREVMAVPGHPFDARAAGCNMLLRDGAVLVRGADDVLEALAGQQLEAGLAGAAGVRGDTQGKLALGDGDGVLVASDDGGTERQRAQPPQAGKGAKERSRRADAPQRAVRTARESHAANSLVEKVGTRAMDAPQGARGAAQESPALSRDSTSASGCRKPEVAAGPKALSKRADAHDPDAPLRGADPAATFGENTGAGPSASGAHAARPPQDGKRPAHPPAMPQHGPADLAHVAGLHREILGRLGPAPLAEDQLIRDLKAPASAVAPALVDLELEGHIARQPGGLLTRVV